MDNSVYVDSGKWKFGRMKMCHMMSESLDSLHAMAEKIGINRKWFQSNASTPHYDICQSKRVLAIQHGAKEADRSKVVELIRFWRANKNANKT